MKHLLLLILFSSILSGAMAQEKTHKDKVPQIVLAPIMNHTDSLTKVQDQLDYLSYCLFKGKKENIQGIGCIAIGVGIVGVAFIYDNYANKPDAFAPNKSITTGTFVVAGGCILSLLGIIQVIDSKKWNKRAHIASNGLGVKYVF